MIQEDAIYEDVKEILVDTLGVDPEEVIPSARFFEDLGGESIDVLDLSFRCEQKYATKVRFQELLDVNRFETDSDGTLSEDTLTELQEQFPFLDVAKLQSDVAKSASSLYTVETIVGFVAYAAAQNEPTR